MFILGYKNTGETTKEFSDKIKKIYNAKYAVICGKLDPMARGHTKILLDENRKLMDNYLNSQKLYQFNLVIGIKTTSDDILGEIIDNGIDSNYYEKTLDYLITVIAKQKTQKFHPYSAIKIKIDGNRKSLHQWTREGKTTYEMLPDKKVEIISMAIENGLELDYDIYRNTVIEKINKISNENRSVFNVDKIIDCWKQLNYKNNILLVKITMEVSSGYYIRMIPYYLYRDLGIPTHIFDINRIST